MKFTRKISRPLRRNAYRLAAKIAFRYGGNPRLRRRAGAALKALGGGVAYAALLEPSMVQTTQIEITIPELDPRLDGYRIAHLTDMHYNVAAGKSYIARIVDKTNALDPDMVALTGDFITHQPRNLDRCFAILSALNAPDGCWVVRGNHDYRTSYDHMRTACRDYGFRLLENEHVVIKPVRHRMQSASGVYPLVGSPSMVLAGVGDMWEGDCRPGIALQGADPGKPTILLSHQGDVAELLTDRQRVDLILSGHTHGGQVRLRGRDIPILANGSCKYVSGLVETGRTRVYISRGVGTSALRLRWNCRPEIALINLHPGKEPHWHVSKSAP
jgi:predicted MPP superfamily phosphohydrolase